MATIDLGKIRFNWQGAYNNSTAYVVNDVVSSGGNSYICKLASTGNAVSNGTYWDLMSQAGTNGTNGTDVGTVITTQGDILYRDGSGLQRLAKGTASQQLAMNSSANARVWITAGGGGAWNMINTAVASNSTTVTVTGIDATYTTYAIVVSDFLSTSDNNSFDIRVGDSSSIKTSGYSWRTLTLKHSVNGYHSRYSSNDSAMSLYGEDGVGINSGEGYGGAVIYLHNARSSTSWPSFSGTGTYVDHNPVGNGFIFSGTYKSVLTGIDRIQFMSGAGNQYSMPSGRLTLYGVSHA